MERLGPCTAVTESNLRCFQQVMQLAHVIIDDEPILMEPVSKQCILGVASLPFVFSARNLCRTCQIEWLTAPLSSCC